MATLVTRRGTGYRTKENDIHFIFLGSSYEKRLRLYSRCKWPYAVCLKKKLKPNESWCMEAYSEPTDPLATMEGRFAFGLRIPNEVGDDSGYKPGMDSNTYFEHLCKSEAGEFIFKTVEGVEGIFQMRNRSKHLYEERLLYVPRTRTTSQPSMIWDSLTQVRLQDILLSKLSRNPASLAVRQSIRFRVIGRMRGMSGITLVIAVPIREGNMMTDCEAGTGTPGAVFRRHRPRSPSHIHGDR